MKKSILLIFALVFSCSTTRYIYRHSSLKVDSMPPGAEVFIMNKLVATTPAIIPEIRIYPAGYEQKNKHLYGYIELKKKGCANVLHKIQPEDFAKGIFFRLNCGNTFVLNK